MRNLLLVALCAASLAVTAGETHYNYFSDASKKYGSAFFMTKGTKPDTHDAAIRIDDPAMVGHRITGIAVPLLAPHATDIKVWLSSELKLKKVDGKKVNDPDILSVDATVVNDTVRVDFDEPYTIPAEGVYVGYSFSINEYADQEQDHLGHFRDANPISIYVDTHENGLFMHNQTNILSWMPMSVSSQRVLALDVFIDGFPENDLVVNSVTRHFMRPGEQQSHTLSVSNHGSEPISALGYEYAIGGRTVQGQLEFETPLVPMWCRNNDIEIAVPELTELATHWGDLRFTTINGNPNPSADDEGRCQTQVLVYDQSPARKVLTEEYTGMWCGYCPRGMVATETMKEKYGDDFICCTIHNNDSLAIITTKDQPSRHVGYPGFSFNRRFMGDIDVSPLSIEALWTDAAQLLSLGSIDVTAYRDQENGDVIADSEFSFIIEEKGHPYSVAYLLTADGLHSDNWWQENYLVGNENYRDEEGRFDRFIDGEASMPDLVFDDVLVYSPALRGSEGSVPSEFGAGQTMRHTAIMPLDAAVNLEGTPLVTDDTPLSVIAVLLDNETGLAVNCARCRVDRQAPVGISQVAQSDALPAYYDLMGRRVQRPAHGVFVQIQDGKATKVSL